MKYIDGIDLRFKDNNPMTNPFDNCFAKYIDSDVNYDYYVLSMKPKYPPYYLIGFVLVFSTWYLKGMTFSFSWLYIAGLLIGCAGFFWSKYFFYLMLLIGSRKAKYYGSLYFIGKSLIIYKLIVSKLINYRQDDYN